MSPEVPPAEAQPPRVSVVIVSHNCREALDGCLNSLEHSLERERMEVLVVDAGSHDGSADADAERPWVNVIRMPMNFGKTRARNIGTRTAKADLILFLDPRVEVHPETIVRLAALVERREDVWAASPVLETPEGARIIHTTPLPFPAQLLQASLKLMPLDRTPALVETAEAVDEYVVLVRRTLLAGMNYLDEKRFSEHWGLLDVFWQIKNAGKKLVISIESRATLHPARATGPENTLMVSDSVAGAAAFTGKHYGFGAGILFRFKCILSALGSLRIGLAWAVLLGKRLDPTQ